MTRRFVLDTNVLVSAILIDEGIPALALKKAEREGVVLYSYATLAELSEVLRRPKFSKYISAANVEGLLSRIYRTWESVTITHKVETCRDPKDDKFLELGLNGQATQLITGDKDLLALVPYRGLEIVTPAQFVA